MTSRRDSRRPRIVNLVQLEDRTTPQAFVATIDPGPSQAGALIELNGFISQANSNADNEDTITLFKGGFYQTAGVIDTGAGNTTFPTIQLLANQKLTIEGNGATFNRDTNGTKFRFLRATGADVTSTLVVNDLTFKGGYATGSNFTVGQSGGAILADGANLVANRVQFLGNTADSDGGAVYLIGGAAQHTFTDVTFDGNNALGVGGAVAFDDSGDLTFTRAGIINNLSTAGAGGVDGGTGNLRFVASKLSKNIGDSGAVHVDFFGGNIDLQDTLVQANQSSGSGTAGVRTESGRVTADRSTFADNVSSDQAFSGTAISGDNITLTNVTVHANTGGATAVEAFFGSVSLTDCTITNNSTADTSGGGVDTQFLTLSGTVLARNTNGSPSSSAQDFSAQSAVTLGYNFIGVAPIGSAAAVGDQIGNL